MNYAEKDKIKNTALSFENISVVKCWFQTLPDFVTLEMVQKDAIEYQ